MTSAAQRRDPQPLARGGEVALICLGGALLLLGAAALAGMGLAAAVAGGGWFWPRGGTPVLGRALAGLLSGHPGQGLPPAQAGLLPTPTATYLGVGCAEALTVLLLAGAAVLVARHRVPTDARSGMATRAQAEQALGLGQLRRARPVIRPDLTRRPRGPAPHRGGAGADRAAAVTPAATPAVMATRPAAPAAPARAGHRSRFAATDVGWRLGRSQTPRGVELFVRYDRTTGVYGEQGSGKTLDLLAPALLAHPGAAVATLTKLDDLLLTVGRRSHGGRPVAVLDPFGAAPGLPEFVWDPVAGCVDPKVAERRAKAFAAGTVTGAVSGGRADGAARFYAAETAKVLQGFLHAAALTGRTLEHVLEWVANPVAAEQPTEILRQHGHAARFWDGLLSGALHGSADTVGNTVTTVQQAMGLFFQPEIRSRCVPTPGRPATDIAGLIAARGTVYLLGREDPYASAAPLMTAVAEQVLDTALALATTSPHGRLTPCFLACLDELPSTTPLPTLRVRMANERALGLSFIYACQTWKQMVVCYGEDEARSLFGLTNNLVVFGGGKDIRFYQELSDLVDVVRVSRSTYSDGPGGTGTSRSGEDVKVLRPGDIRRIPDKHALVVAGNAPPMVARLRRCLDGADGARLQVELAAARTAVGAARAATPDPSARTAAALGYARAHALTAPDQDADHPADGRADDTPGEAGAAGAPEAAPEPMGDAGAGAGAGPGGAAAAAPPVGEWPW